MRSEREAGDPSNTPAFDLLYMKYGAAIMVNVIVRYFDTEDKCREHSNLIWASVFQHCDKYNPEKANLHTWLYTIATNHCRQAMRQQAQWEHDPAGT